MNALEPNPVKKKRREIKPFTTASLTPTLALIRKTLIFDLCTVKRIILSVFFMVLVPALVLAFVPSSKLSGEERLVQLLGIVTWYVNFSLLFPIIIINATGPLISEELRSGTLLFLVSKPINRTKIILSKFIALVVFAITVIALSLFIICLIAILKYSFNDIGSYLGIFFLYGLIITFFFGGITMGFSAAFSRPRNVLLIPLFLVIFSFLVFMMFKPFLMFAEDNWYEQYYLFNFDIGYHFSNIFLWIGESFDPYILDYSEAFFWMFGITKMETQDYETIFVQTNYYPPEVSFLFLMVIAGILITVGVFSLKKRDISG